MPAAGIRIVHPDPTPLELQIAPKRDLIEFAGHLTRRGFVTGSRLATFNSDRPSNRNKITDLLSLTELSPEEFADEVAHFYRLPRAQLPQVLAAPSLARSFSPRFLREMMVYPCRTESGGNLLVVADPTDLITIRAAQLVLGGTVELAVASSEDIKTVLSERLEVDAARVPEELSISAHFRDDDIESLRDLASGAPVVRAVNDLLEKAIELRATDIHVEPFRTGLILRMRIDGLLRVVPTPADVLPQALISRIKILAGLNIAERRLPQDGAAHLHIARSELDIRVATLPTQFGEAAVVRLLPKDRGALEIAKLGLCSRDQETLHRLLKLPHGIIAVTGPTGSGKTTTLATMLTALNDTTRKILTIEDPIEYEIPGINQSQVKPEISFTFATALRAFVRQDPDVIMVGEIRDAETARIAIHAALTGHLVLTTLHTESATAAVPRLLDLGVESFLLQSTLRAVIAQRLVRVFCDRCKIERHLTASAIADEPRYEILGLKTNDVVTEPSGCERCGKTGYRGRTGLFEILEVSNEVRSLIGWKSESGILAEAATRAGMTTMFMDGIAKCRAGVTSPAEVLRVTTAS